MYYIDIHIHIYIENIIEYRQTRKQTITSNLQEPKNIYMYSIYI